MLSKGCSWIIRSDYSIFFYVNKLIVLGSFQYHCSFHMIFHIIENCYSYPHLFACKRTFQFCFIFPAKDSNYLPCIQIEGISTLIKKGNTPTYSMALFNIPNPRVGLMEKADTIQWTGLWKQLCDCIIKYWSYSRTYLTGTSTLNIYLPWGPMFTSFQTQTFSYWRCSLLNRNFLNSASSVLFS